LALDALRLEVAGSGVNLDVKVCARGIVLALADVCRRLYGESVQSRRAVHDDQRVR